MASAVPGIQHGKQADGSIQILRTGGIGVVVLGIGHLCQNNRFDVSGHNPVLNTDFDQIQFIVKRKILARHGCLQKVRERRPVRVICKRKKRREQLHAHRKIRRCRRQQARGHRAALGRVFENAEDIESYGDLLPRVQFGKVTADQILKIGK